mmetsp:Transcript_53328/g.103118  ORF Transcript_53328/g.103118 Transcript_53328/m.103118 type:complete len:398 (+) Transcript_53328:89-1282(+)|eukprot:CAMPEP_0172668442 /NCGR_PEP_ID=MMETSP1074-20121228/9066_1 /TAXON_ID=2916 /ORGANISM="Ceratium fusus, Strain PA161109" /LENGTH=397 /DNA_ID=CAMNT_0013485091 /DNA_START=34 /DNA_END=1227 /DNA_ORIENTATION=+
MATPPPVSGDAKLCVTVAEAQLVRIFDRLKPNQDVFVQLVCGYEDGTEKVVGKTEVCYRGNFHPKWNEDFVIDRDPSQGSRTLKFRVHIDHIWRNPVLCGEAEFAVDNLWTKAKSGPQRVVVPLFKRGSERTGILRISVAMQVGGASLGRYTWPGADVARPASAGAAVVGKATSAANPSPQPVSKAAPSAASPQPLPANTAFTQMPASPAAAQHQAGADVGRFGPPQQTPVQRAATNPFDRATALAQHGPGGDVRHFAPSQPTHVQRLASDPADRKPVAANKIPHPPPQQQKCAGGTVIVPQLPQQQQTQQQRQQQQQSLQQHLNALRPDKSQGLPPFSYPPPPALLVAQHAMDTGVCGGYPCSTTSGNGTMVSTATTGVYATGLSGQWWNSFIDRG